ncbi:MAG: alpha/beta hydrolase [Rhodospirillaceae bacterium]
MRSIAILTLMLAPSVHATDCAADNRTRVKAGEECLVIHAYGEPTEKTKLVVFIHGDGSSGGPSDYLFKMAASFGAAGVVSVGLIRPGYYDRNDNRSTGDSYRDGDGYREDVIAAVTAAVTALKAHYKAARVVLAGHSGGAAISAVILGKHPGLVDAVVLAACPCNVPEWWIMKRGSNNWTWSLSPHDFIAGVATNAKIVAVTGGNDGNTRPVIAKDYVEKAKRRGITAEFIELPGVSDNGSARSQEFKDAVRRLLDGG